MRQGPAAALLALALAAPVAALGKGAVIRAAAYSDPTDRYDHGALGDPLEWGALDLTLTDGRKVRLRLPISRVFEDTEPRVVDLDGDGAPEVIVVETDLAQGAQLAVYGPQGKIAATAFIGRTHRWLAPVGAADLDGDGRMEIAYVETPHLGRTLKIVRYVGGQLVSVAAAPALTNHRFGDPFIQGRIATCDGRPAVLTADADWRAVVATWVSPVGFQSKALAPYAGPDSFARVPGCD